MHRRPHRTAADRLRVPDRRRERERETNRILAARAGNECSLSLPSLPPSLPPSSDDATTDERGAGNLSRDFGPRRSRRSSRGWTTGTVAVIKASSVSTLTRVPRSRLPLAAGASSRNLGQVFAAISVHLHGLDRTEGGGRRRKEGGL